MDVLELLHELGGSGLTVTRDGASLVIQPASKLTDGWRARLREAKPELLVFLHEAERTTAELIAAAMRACDAWGDGSEARQAMCRECLETPLHQRRDLLAHFVETYPPCVHLRRGCNKGGSDAR